MNRNGSIRRVKVSADGAGVVSHAGVGMLRELAQGTGLVAALNAALADTYRGPWVHSPGRVLTDLTVAVADGADAISGIAVLTDRRDVFAPVASMPTAWRVLDRVDAGHLPAVRAARAVVRERAWAAGAGAGPDLSGSCASPSTPRSRSRTEKGERGRDVEEDVRVPPVAGVPGPPGDRRRGGAGRAAAPG